MEPGAKVSVMDTSNLVDETLYRQIVGSLIYLTTTRDDLSFLVGLISRFMDKPRKIHWKETNKILRYVRVALNYGLNMRMMKISSFKANQIQIGQVVLMKGILLQFTPSA